jgi:hypothetical protein
MEDWKNKTTKKKKIELAFPKVKTEDDAAGQYISKGKGGQREEEGGRGLLERFSTSIEEVTDWFKQYQVDTIELWISGVIESAGVTRLVVSAKGEGGLRVVLKPRSQVV